MNVNLGTLVDVVVVSYNSTEHLRSCVEPLTRLEDVSVVVVDNASGDDSIAAIADLPLHVIAADQNGGFAKGCNLGWRYGASPYVLFLNPDARIEAVALQRLVETLEARPAVAIAAPRMVAEEGSLNFSLRRFPRLRSTYSQALFLHHLFPMADWVDEAIRRPAHYETPGPQEWVSGACVLVRRSVLEQLGGWDEGFFLYCEDIDLCRRIHDAGLQVYFDPKAVVVHAGGASSALGQTLPLLAASRIRYASLHRSRGAALAERIGIALEAATRLVGGRGGHRVVLGHARALGRALTPHRFTTKFG